MADRVDDEVGDDLADRTGSASRIGAPGRRRAIPPARRSPCPAAACRRGDDVDLLSVQQEGAGLREQGAQVVSSGS
jgi:hypothetical protein